MQLEIPFGDATISATLPDDTYVVKTTPKTPLPPLDDLESALDNALNRPIDLPPLRELVKPGANVTIAFDDATVTSFTPIRSLAIRKILALLDERGVNLDTVNVICANALHRKFRPNELATILGDDLVETLGSRLFCHDAENPDELEYLGTTPNGYDVEISRYVTESDLTIYVNASHNRGFNGGWKSVAVGLSTWRSIRHHHTPDGMSMSVKNNRMHHVLDEMGALVDEKTDCTIFKLDTLTSDLFNVAKLFTGTTGAARNAVLETLNEIYPPRRAAATEKYDVVVYGVPNYSPYTAFSFMNPILTLISSGLGYLGGTIEALGKPGCTVIMATPCPERWDTVHHAPYPKVWDNVLSITQDPYAIERDYSEEYAHDAELVEKYRNGYSFHPIHGILATHPLKRLKHAGKIVVAGVENPATAQHLGFEAAESVEAALERAKAIHGERFTTVYAAHPPAPTKIGL